MQQRFASVVEPKNQRPAFFSVLVEIGRTLQDVPVQNKYLGLQFKDFKDRIALPSQIHVDQMANDFAFVSLSCQIWAI